MIRKRFNTLHSPPSSSKNIFCFPWAGGSSTSFFPIIPYLNNCSIYSAALSARGSCFSIPPEKDLKQLIRIFSSSIKEYLATDYIFFGYSMGGIIAFELVRELRRQSFPLPRALVVSGTRAPQLFARDREPLVSQLPDDEFIEHVCSLEGTPEELLAYPDFFQLMMPALRADFYICDNYQYKEEAPLEIPIIALGGKDDTDVCASDLEGWAIQTSFQLKYHTYEGGHFFIHHHWSDIAAILETS